MKLQYLCHVTAVLALGGIAAAAVGDTAAESTADHNYPTIARVEYVNACMGKNGGKMAALYQCACAIDRIAVDYSYDDYVEASTFAHYATLPGEGGGIFRDSDVAKAKAKKFRDVESGAWRGCGIAH